MCIAGALEGGENLFVEKKQGDMPMKHDNNFFLVEFRKPIIDFDFIVFDYHFSTS